MEDVLREFKDAKKNLDVNSVSIGGTKKKDPSVIIEFHGGTTYRSFVFNINDAKRVV